MKHWRGFFEDKYLGAWVMDEAGRDLTAEIEGVVVEQVTNPDTNTTEPKLLITFKGKKKGMICNKTNAKSIVSMYGVDTDDWAGKRITLYATDVRAFGQTHRCIRIREKQPQQDSRNREPGDDDPNDGEGR